jgi:hypothetical protein
MPSLRRTTPAWIQPPCSSTLQLKAPLHWIFHSHGARFVVNPAEKLDPRTGPTRHNDNLRSPAMLRPRPARASALAPQPLPRIPATDWEAPTRSESTFQSPGAFRSQFANPAESSNSSVGFRGGARPLERVSKLLRYSGIIASHILVRGHCRNCETANCETAFGSRRRGGPKARDRVCKSGMGPGAVNSALQRLCQRGADDDRWTQCAGCTCSFGQNQPGTCQTGLGSEG